MCGVARWGSAVVAHAGVVDNRVLRLADVIVHPPQPTVIAAVSLAARTMRDLTGCTVVVVAIESYGLLVFKRANRSATSSTRRLSIRE
jgi:hypothetical protein